MNQNESKIRYTGEPPKVKRHKLAGKTVFDGRYTWTYDDRGILSRPCSTDSSN